MPAQRTEQVSIRTTVLIETPPGPADDLSAGLAALSLGPTAEGGGAGLGVTCLVVRDAARLAGAEQARRGWGWGVGGEIGMRERMRI